MTRSCSSRDLTSGGGSPPTPGNTRQKQNHRSGEYSHEQGRSDHPPWASLSSGKSTRQVEVDPDFSIEYLARYTLTEEQREMYITSLGRAGLAS